MPALLYIHIFIFQYAYSPFLIIYKCTRRQVPVVTHIKCLGDETTESGGRGWDECDHHTTSVCCFCPHHMITSHHAHVLYISACALHITKFSTCFNALFFPCRQWAYITGRKLSTTRTRRNTIHYDEYIYHVIP